MRKTLLTIFSLFIVASMVLAGCASPTPETIIQTVEVPGEEVVVTVEVPVTQEVIVEATPQAPAAGEVFERSETLYTSGTQWGPPSSWNPFNTGNYATGTIGLCYETLFIYDPLTNEYQPWLAESGEFTSDTVYELKLREGITWSDGEPLTAEDVKFTFDMAQEAPVNISTVWDWLDSVEAVDDYNLVFTFKEALYQQWGNTLYTTPIVPAHVWGEFTVEQITSGANENPICSGPYVYESHDQSRMVWVKRDGWWATDALGLDIAPTRIVDIVNGSNNVAMGMVLQGGLDLSNNFLPGVATLVRGGYGIQTYYPEPPYMLSANTAWLLMNLTKPPMDDPAFRRAMAFAIDVDQIVNVVYGNIVQKSNPTGLLPIWDQYVDQDVVDELGFTYDPDQARAILAEAGYADSDGDGFVEAPDGSKIELKVMVPFGWTDWMESINVISASAQAVGINLVTDFPDYPQYVEQRNAGTFDMMIANDAQMSNTPWTYYNWMFQNPIEDIATLQNGNYGRYDNQEAFDLVDALDRVPVEDIDGMREIMSQLQRIHLTDMPLIPLWYNGLWSQVSTAAWTNWPSAAEDANHYLPAMWRGYLNMTGILMLAELEPVPPAE
ncbi:MAG: ABC transporter substrate-binding protein [Chloroflexi bacterium]|jgi:peptide/nickel transport system substrate-binding protein|nr:ABC transporter substrate-binding protein [Chloroflexota bacterium]